MIERICFWGLLIAALILLAGCAQRPYDHSKRELIEGLTK